MKKSRLPASSATPFDELSPRRRELVQLLAKGLTNDEIATAMGITPGTVRSHVTAVLAQLDVANRTEAAAAFVAWEASPTQVAVVMKRPAIAVLSILALDEEPRTRAVAAALTEDLASLFSRWCWFPVISTSSSACARGLGKTTCEVGQQLGARFLVDGGLRIAGGTWRLSLHIDDVETGHRIWTDRRDYPAEALFDAQDAVCEAAVAAAYPVLVARVQAVLAPRSRPPVEFAAWELAHEGMALRALREADANAAALRCFREALAREPHLVLAHFGVGLACYDAVLNQWGSKAAALELLRASADRCIEHAPYGGEGHFLLGRYLQSRGEWERAIAPLEAAVGRNPSFALAHATLSQSLQAAGRSDESLVRMEHAVRLGPCTFVAMLSTLHFMRGEYEQSLEAAERALLSNPRYSFAYALAAASAWWLGDAGRGQAHLRVLRANSPPFRPSGFAATFGEKVDAVERLARALEALSAGR
ncbi:LuxR C-terminal-related transcriptional regulator [Nannocystis pusilla]|uniref:LuxR C-terminal-related transcriptional regulator n=1 Tax=Nannocystis pusilla TaxID=889268 RepID=A0ABS7TQA3_9BACT|nr:LuxR C-terminal-related transcriptional regulator [Nannocystis pusilla]